jgi:hypothetical protein
VIVITERICDDCMAGDHEACRREGGYLDDHDNSNRCGCHLTAHALDNRARLEIPPELAHRPDDDNALLEDLLAAMARPLEDG